uniref:Uncharacterized protein n=1 Tax=Rhizophora mucronata TaxID=61149 RepID=A0A2P2LLY5_RHIMU
MWGGEGRVSQRCLMLNFLSEGESWR